MPYQLIYTSAARLLDSPLSGYGVVARSEKMPAALVSKLIELSEYKEPANQGIEGPQFSYQVEECNNTLYHIFSSVRPAGADYSKRSCHVAHHLILRGEEMHALCRSAAPPTPAGILLSLELRRYWVHRWQKEPEYLDEGSMPPLWESPAGNNFPTWLIFTGRGENAGAFQTPPFHQGCLVLVPQKTQSRDILRLLHESYALSPTLGWGVAFCTYSVEGDTLESRRRLFSVANSALHQRAQRVGFPTLDIRPGLVISPPQQPPAPPANIAAPPMGASQSATPPAATTTAPTMGLTARLSSLPHAQEYHYAEDRSEDIFETPWYKPRRRPTRGRSSAALMLLFLVVALGAYALLGRKQSQPEQSTPQQQADIRQTLASEHAQESTTTAETDPQADDAPEPLHTEPSADEPIPEPIEDDSQETTPEPPSTEDIAEGADISIADIDKQVSDAEGNDTDADANLLPDRELAKGSNMAATVGNELPAKLTRLLPSKEGEEMRFEEGDYYLHLGAENADQQAVYTKGEEQYWLHLQPGKGSLTLHCTRAKEEYILTASDEKIPQVHLSIKGNKLVSCAAQGCKYVAIQMPLIDEEAGKAHTVLVLPQIQIPLTMEGNESVPLRTESKGDKRHTEKRLPKMDEAWSNLIDQKSDTETYRKREIQQAQKDKKESWVHKVKQEITLKAPIMLYLPELESKKYTIDIKTGSKHATCTQRKDSETSFIYTREYDPVPALLKKFKGYMETPIGDNKTGFRTMEDVRKVLNMLTNSEGHALKQSIARYIKFYDIPELGDILRKALTGAQAYQLTMPSIASNLSKKDREKEKREAETIIINYLKIKDVRKDLRKVFNEFLSKKLEDFLNELHAEWQKPSPKQLILEQVKLEESGRLRWIFRLQEQNKDQ